VSAPDLQVYLNGEFLPGAQACVPVMDRGLLFGDSVYEVIPCYAGRPFRLEQHLERLDHSLAAIRLPNPLSREAWRRLLERLAAQLPGQDQQLYLQVTRGAYPTRDHRLPEHPRPTVLAMTSPLNPHRADYGERGISAITVPDIRWQRCDIKATSLLGNVLMRQQAVDAGADEAILIRDGEALEGTATSLFLVRDGGLVTPPKGPHLLPGVTRDLVLELAQAHGIPWAEAAIPVAQLGSADEIWLTSSTREVAPVTRLDGRPVGDGRPGPLWRRMHALFRACRQQLRQAGDCRP